MNDMIKTITLLLVISVSDPGRATKYIGSCDDALSTTHHLGDGRGQCSIQEVVAWRHVCWRVCMLSCNFTNCKRIHVDPNMFFKTMFH